MLRPNATTCTEFENRLSRQSMETMTHCKSSPPKLPGRSRGILRPIQFALSLHLQQVSLEHHKTFSELQVRCAENFSLIRLVTIRPAASPNERRACVAGASGSLS